MNRKLILALGGAASLATAIVFDAATGTSRDLAAQIETAARAELVRLEMGQVQARVERSPLRRTLVLSGPADSFQRSELDRRIGALPGVADARWSNRKPAGLAIPLIAEAMTVALLGFLLGLLLAYLVELRRRATADRRF